MSTTSCTAHAEPRHKITTVLFDLDGTLLDTAPAMAYTLNRLLQEQQRPSLPFEHIRPIVSHGSGAMIRFGFGIDTNDPTFTALQQRFLALYEQFLTRETQLFPGAGDLLARLEQEGFKWGVVTNKPDWLTLPLMSHLQLDHTSACIVCGNTTSERKPHPKPLLHACELAGAQPHQCIYIGDAQRDIEAGQRAGMKTLVATFGYIGSQEQPSQWGADGCIENISQAHTWITRYNCADNDQDSFETG